MGRSGFWEQSPEDPLVRVPKLQPLTFERASEPFSHPDWLFEIKWDGFRSLVSIKQGKCRLVSRQGNDFKSFRTLRECLLAELKVRSAVLDGEIVCLNDEESPSFAIYSSAGRASFCGVRSALA